MKSMQFVSSGGNITIKDLASSTKVCTPLSCGIQNLSGDSTLPPNSVDIKRINGFTSHTVINAGYSSSAKSNISPSCISYVFRVYKADTENCSLEVRMTLEFVNPHRGESMMVSMKKWKEYINDSSNELLLIDTSFQDFVEDEDEADKGHWVDICTSIRYRQEAEDIQQAVLQDPSSGQVAATASTSGAIEQAKLGPCGSKGRVTFTYHCPQLFAYAEMALDEGQVSSRQICPLLVFLPYCLLGVADSATRLTLSLHTSEGTLALDPTSNILAYADIAKQLEDQLQSKDKKMTVIGCSDLDSSGAFAAEWTSVPPQPVALLFLLSSPGTNDLDADLADFVLVDGNSSADHTPTSLNPTIGAGVAEVFAQEAEEEQLLTVQPPGIGPRAHLLRIKVSTANNQLSSPSVRIFSNLTFTDASGSTGMQLTGAELRSKGVQKTVRDAFNDLFILRFIKRLEAIPILLRSGLLRPQDVIVELVYEFDDKVKKVHKFVYRVSELMVEGCVEAIIALIINGKSLPEKHSQNIKITQIEAFIKSIRNIKPSGATNFAAPAEMAQTDLPTVHKKVMRKYNLSQGQGQEQAVTTTAFVQWDTDGGHNSGDCYDTIKSMVSACNVVGGCVTGVGSWVDQECAHVLSGILKGPCLLTLMVPPYGSEGANHMIRGSLNAWVKALRALPVRLNISAGAIEWKARQGLRHENGVDILAAKYTNIRSVSSSISASHDSYTRPTDCTCPGLVFEKPGINDDNFTSSRLSGLLAGDSCILYALCRFGNLSDLLNGLEILSNGIKLHVVQGGKDSVCGVILAQDWMSALTSPSSSTGVVLNTTVSCKSLIDRVLDDLSFNWNLPTPSGSTAYLGRARSALRASIDVAHQPDDPLLEYKAAKDWKCKFGGVGFKYTIPSSSFYGFGSGSTIAASTSSSAFGATSVASASASGFGAAQQHTSALGTSGAGGMSFGSVSSTGFGFGATTTAFGSLSTTTGFGQSFGTTPSTGLGTTRFGAPASRPAQNRIGGFGATSAGFGFGSASGASTPGFGFGSASGASTPGFGFGSASGSKVRCPDPAPLHWMTILFQTEYLRLPGVADGRPLCDTTTSAVLCRVYVDLLIVSGRNATGISYHCDNHPQVSSDRLFHCLGCVKSIHCLRCNDLCGLCGNERGDKWRDGTAKFTVEVRGSRRSLEPGQAEDVVLSELLPIPSSSPSSSSLSASHSSTPAVADTVVQAATLRLTSFVDTVVCWWELLFGAHEVPLRRLSALAWTDMKKTPAGLCAAVNYVLPELNK